MNSIYEVTQKLEEMFLMDQKLRKLNSDDPQIDIIDQNHRKIFKEIFAKWGLIKKNIFGVEASHHAWLLVQHFPEEEVPFMKEYLSLMKNNLYEVSITDTAYLEDRVLMYEGLSQKYGTQLKWNDDSQKYELWPLQNQNEVNVLRKNVGLGTLEDYLKDLSS